MGLEPDALDDALEETVQIVPAHGHWLTHQHLGQPFDGQDIHGEGIAPVTSHHGLVPSHESLHD